jgi:hypothetical protein
MLCVEIGIHILIFPDSGSLWCDISLKLASSFLPDFVSRNLTAIVLHQDTFVVDFGTYRELANQPFSRRIQ